MKILSRKELRIALLKEVKKEILLEQRKNEKYCLLIDAVMHENKNVINSKYLSKKEINESILDTLADMASPVLDNLLPGFIGQFKQKLISDMMYSLDINIKSRFVKSLINVLEEIKYTQLIGYFKNWGSGGCEGLIDDITRGLSDSVQEAILEYFGMEIQGQGVFGGTGREAVQGAVNDKLMPMLKPMLSDFICNLPVGNIFSQIKDVATGKKSVDDIMSGLFDKAKKTSYSGAVSALPKVGDNTALGKLKNQIAD